MGELTDVFKRRIRNPALLERVKEKEIALNYTSRIKRGETLWRMELWLDGVEISVPAVRHKTPESAYELLRKEAEAIQTMLSTLGITKDIQAYYFRENRLEERRYDTLRAKPV